MMGNVVMQIKLVQVDPFAEFGFLGPIGNLPLPQKAIL
jgi:hypothetical protein